MNWNVPLEFFFNIWPETRTDIEQQLRLGYPLVTLDDVEFYFEDSEFFCLSELVIQAWRINNNQESQHFSYGWIRRGLTFTQVQSYLVATGISFSIQRGSSGTPHLRTNTGALFAFYAEANYEQGEEIELAKIYLRNPLSA